ncbi:MAG TPA: YqgE/AlgH family protein [Bacteroidia bacterium]|nr:YqgE/AlgH family protein [Bacteroidia bacterium]
MKPKKVIETKFSRIKAGSVLIAQPCWKEPDYKRAIILITDYSAHAARGIIINKASNIHVYDLMDEPGLRIDKMLYYGGSESMEIISYIHNIPFIPEADYFGNGIYFGGDPISVEELIKENRIDLDKMKFFAGSTAWSSGELEHEIANNRWWVSDISSRELFYSVPEKLWTQKLMLNGNMFGLFAEEFDPSLS